MIINSLTMYLKLFLLILFVTKTFAQKNQEMISSMASHSKTKKGFIVKQTVGQQSVIGNYTTKGLFIFQGFQQANWSRIILENTSPEFLVSLYPNPFENILKIKHNSEQHIKVNIFNVAGKLVYENHLNTSHSYQSIDLSELSSGIYLLSINSKLLSYYTKIFKK